MQVLEIEQALRSGRITNSVKATIKQRFEKAFVAPAPAPNSGSAPGELDQPTLAKLLGRANELLQILLTDEQHCEGLGKTIEELSGELTTDLISHLTTYSRQILNVGATADGTPFSTQNGGHAASSSKVEVSTVLLAVAQCLFALTYKYQSTERQVQQVCVLLTLILQDRVTHLQEASMHSLPARASSLLAFLITGSLCNMLTAANALVAADPASSSAAPSTTYVRNRLLQNKELPKFLGRWIVEARTAMNKDTLHHGGHSRHTAAQTPLGDHHSTETRLPTAHAANGEQFLAIAIWAIGVYLHAVDGSKANQRLSVDGKDCFDLVLAALIGEGTTEKERDLFGGKAPKWFAAHFPPSNVANTPPSLRLSLPAWMLAGLGYGLFHYTIASMLPVVRHVADLDIASYTKFSVARDAGIVDKFLGNGGTGTGLFGLGGAPPAGPGYPYGAYNRQGRSGYDREPMSPGGLFRGPNPQDRYQSRIDFAPYSSYVAHLLDMLAVTVRHLPSNHVGAAPPNAVGVGGGEVTDEGYLRLVQELPAEVREQFHCLGSFLWVKMVLHIRQVVETHKQPSRWEPYTLKLMNAYFQVVSALAKDPESAGRMYTDLESQLDCTELLWETTSQQILQLIGIQTSSTHSPHSVGMGFSAGGAPGNDEKNEIAIMQELQQRGFKAQQLAPSYRQTQQLKMVCSLLNCLTQIAGKAPEVVLNRFSTKYLFMLLCAPAVPQTVAGCVWELLAATCQSTTVQRGIMNSLRETHIVKLSDAERKGAQSSASPLAGGGLFSAGSILGNLWSAEASKAAAVAAGDSQDIIEQFRQECKNYRYSITIGFLQLLNQLLDFTIQEGDLPLILHLLRFVADEVLIGFYSRTYTDKAETWIVATLAIGVLTKAFDPSIWPTGRPPCPDILAASRAPSDVVGELMGIIGFYVRDMRTALSPAHMAAVRHGVQLIHTAMKYIRLHEPEPIFTLEARTFNSEEFLFNAVSMLASTDLMVRQLSISLLHLLSGPLLNRVTGTIQGSPDGGRFLIAEGRAIFDFRAPPTFVHYSYPRALELLQPKPHRFSLDQCRSLMISLLIKNANDLTPSITSWLCGYGLIPKSIANPNMSQGVGAGSSATSAVQVSLLSRFSCLEIILRSINDEAFCKQHGTLASQYVQLLYCLKANPATFTPELREMLLLRDALEFIEALYHLSEETDADSLERYGFILKSLALDVYRPIDVEFIRQHLNRMLLPVSADMDALGSISSAATRRRPSEEPRFATWLRTAMKSAFSFPDLKPPKATGTQLTAMSDRNCLQFNLSEVYRLFRLEQPDMPTDDLRKVMEQYLVANQCFEQYSKIVSFIEGWCAFANIASTNVSDISHSTLFLLLSRSLEAIFLTKDFTTDVQSRALSALTATAVSLLSALHECVVHRDVQHELPVAEAQNILTLLTHALVQFGERSGEMRNHIYSCFAIFLSFPDVNIDPAVLLRLKEPLFERLQLDAGNAQDPANQIMAIRTLQRFCSVKDVALSFIHGRRVESTGAKISIFVAGVLSSVDNVINQAFASFSHRDCSNALFLAEAGFSFLTGLVGADPLSLFHAGVVRCTRLMTCWVNCRTVLAGRAPAESLLEGQLTATVANLQAAKDLIRRVFTSVFRFFNSYLRHLRMNAEAVEEIRCFVSEHLPLLSHFFEQPFAASRSVGGPSVTLVGGSLAISSVNLRLLEQAVAFLLLLSQCDTLAPHAPTLIQHCSLCYLLTTLVHHDTRNGKVYFPDDSDGNGALSPVTGLGLASTAQKLLLIRCTKVLLMFLTNCLGPVETEATTGIGASKSKMLASESAVAVENELLLQTTVNALENLLSAAKDPIPVISHEASRAVEVCAVLIQTHLLQLRRRFEAKGETFRLDPQLRQTIRRLLENSGTNVSAQVAQNASLLDLDRVGPGGVDNAMADSALSAMGRGLGTRAAAPFVLNLSSVLSR